jgi:hypothetical protein
VARAIFVLLPDKREQDTLITHTLNPALQKAGVSSTGFGLLSHSDRWPSAWWLRTALAVHPDTVLEQDTQRTDWHYPAQLLWRREEDNRWNYAVAGLSTPLTGEGDE